MAFNRYVKLDIERKHALDSQGMKMLDSIYDGFFKIASQLDIADAAEGDVESPQGWFAMIDMSGLHHGEVLSAVFGVDPNTEYIVPDYGFYLTQENSDGIIYVYEMRSREEMAKRWVEMDEAFSKWSSDAEREADEDD